MPTPKNSRNSFKTSVIRHKQSDSKPNNNNTRISKMLGHQDLQDMFGGLSLSSRTKRRLSTELSTVKEDDLNEPGDEAITNTQRQNTSNRTGPYATLTEDNIQRLEHNSKDDGTFKKTNILEKYAESSDGYDDFDDDSSFDMHVQDAVATNSNVESSDAEDYKNPFVSIPVSKYTIKQRHGHPRRIQTSESMNSLSSVSMGKSIPASTSTTSFTETDSEQSDYSGDFEDADFDQVDLMDKFKERQNRAEARENKLQAERKMKYNRLHDSLKDTNFVEEGQRTVLDDFEDVDEIDPSKLNRFTLGNKYDRLDRKRSMPALMRNQQSALGIAPAPKRAIRKYSSTLDLPSRMPLSYRKKLGSRYPPVSLSLKSRPYYNDNNQISDSDDNFSDDITITLSDYKKLKRKSHRIDISKYAEAPNIHAHAKTADHGHGHHHNHRSHRQNTKLSKDDMKDLTNTVRLSKEGKLKIIRPLGKHNVKQILPGHLYGEIVYDPDQMKWCGNDEDLLRFESVSKPRLIKNYRTSRKRKSKKNEQLGNPRFASAMELNESPQVVGNMVYDNKNLRWVSVTGKYEDDPFDNINDTITSEKMKPSQQIRKSFSRRMMKSQAGDRSISQKPSRLTSSISCSSIPNYAKDIQNENPLHVGVDAYRSWKSEETRWIRKVGNWFPCENDSLDFCYELKTFLDDQ